MNAFDLAYEVTLPTPPSDPSVVNGARTTRLDNDAPPISSSQAVYIVGGFVEDKWHDYGFGFTLWVDSTKSPSWDTRIRVTNRGLWDMDWVIRWAKRNRAYEFLLLSSNTEPRPKITPRPRLDDPNFPQPGFPNPPGPRSGLSPRSPNTWPNHQPSIVPTVTSPLGVDCRNPRKEPFRPWGPCTHESP